MRIAAIGRHMLNPFPQASYVLQRSVGLWLSVWAIRYTAGIDYKLSAQAKAVRWIVVLTTFAATALPGASLGWVRVSFYLTGLVFLCWPNFAYHLNRLFERWPTVEGRVNSVQAKSPSKWAVAYDFEIGGERYGGLDTVGVGADGQGISNGGSILVQYDPLNPGRSSHIQGRR